MNQIIQKVNQAKRRLFFQALILSLPKFVFGFLCIAFIAILVPKIFAVDFLASDQASQIWLNSWAWGSVGAGLLSCIVWTWMNRDSTQSAALQIDSQYGLKERVSTSISLADSHQNDEFASAVIQDTSKKIADVEIRDQFPVQPDRWTLIPVLPAIAIIAISFMPQMTYPLDPSALNEKELKKEDQKKLKKTTLKKKEKKANPKAESEIEASKVLNKKIDALKKKIDSNKLTKKEALMSINDMKKAIKKEQAKLGKSKAFKEMLNNFKKSKSGISKKIEDAIKNGEFKKAKEAIKDLADKIAKGKITKKDAEKIAQELQKMKKEFEKKKQELENKKKDLQRQIDQAKKKGDQEKAADLQKQKEELEKQQRQQKQMDNICKQCNKLGDALKKAAQNKNGKPNEQQMQQMKEAMKNLEQQLKEMELDQKQSQELKELMDQMQQMQKECNGNCPNPGKGLPNNKESNKKGGKGLGPGKGEGERPLGDDPDKKFRDTQVRPKVNGKGEVARIGKVGGANRKGISLADIRKNIEQAAKTESITPDNLQAIPNHQKDHVREFFKKNNR